MYTKLIREIRNSISNKHLPSEFLQELSEELGEAIESVNSRLTHVVKILSDGYRDEAIEIAEQEPSLQDLVSQLDMPEREQWDLLMDGSMMEKSPQLLMGAADQLELAYEERAKLETLLKKHRLLALGQAPLRPRIQILQRLAEQDPTNPIWIDDSAMLQRARLAQIKTEFQIAKSKNRKEKLQALTEELSGSWDIPISKHLKQEVAGVSDKLARIKARDQMSEVAHQLNECLLEFDDETARGLRERWLQLDQIARLTPDDDVLKLGNEPLRWLKEVDEDNDKNKNYDLSLSKLEQGIDENLPIEQLDQRIYEAQKYEREIPETLVHRVNSYREGLESKHRRKNFGIVGASLAVLVVLIIAIVFFVNQRSNYNKLVNARQTMEGFASEVNFKSGEAYYENLSEDLKNDGEIIRLLNKLEQTQNQEIQRLENFERLIALVDLEGSLDLTLDDHISEAENYADTTAEKDRIQALGNRLQSERQRRQTGRDELFLKKLAPYETKLKQIINEKPSSQTIQAIDQLISDIEKLNFDSLERQDGKAGISSSKTRRASSLVERADARKGRIEFENKSIVDLSKLKSFINLPTTHAEAIEKYARQYPDNINSLDFKATADELDFSTNLLQWQAFAKRLDAKLLNKLSPESADPLLKQLNSIKSVDIGVPKSSLIELEEFLEKSKEVKSPPDDLKENLDLLEDFFEQVKYEEIKIALIGDEFYYLSQPFNEAKETTIKFFIDDGRTQGKKLSVEELEKLSVDLAPHCAISLEINNVLKTFADKDLEGGLLKLIEMALGSELDPEELQNLDPLVQCEYLRQLLLFTSLTSTRFKDFAEEQSTKLSIKNLAGNDWQARTAAIEDLRKDAVRYLRRFKEDFEELELEVGPSINDLEAMIKWKSIADYKVVGILLRTDDAWEIDFISSQLQPNTPLFCLVPDSRGFLSEEKIGAYDANTNAYKDVPGLQAGRLVFINTGKN
ncbi:hypothetical protein N9Z44_00105 [Mariniblastus sp.]|nr:hypothetical protein [Mariniblastus sp.]